MTPASRRAVAGTLLAAALAVAGAAAAAAGSPPAGLTVFDSGGLQAEHAALILSGQEGGELAMEAVAHVVPGPPARLALLVELAGAPLVGEAEAARAEVEVLAYALDPAGAVVASALRTVVVDLREEAGRLLLDSGLKLFVELEVPPGEVSLRVLARDRASGRLGLRILPLTVPASASPAPWVGRPLIADPPGDWLEVGHTAAALGARWGIERAPAALPVLFADEETTLVLPTRGIPGGPRNARLRITDEAGAPVAELPIELAASSGGDRQLLSADFRPLGLATARYRLAVVVETPGGEIAGEPITVVTLAGGGTALAWPMLLREPSGDQVAASDDGAESRRSRLRIDPRPVRREYLAVLRLLGSGRREEALEALHALETDTFRQHGDKALGAVWTVEVETARALAARDRETLLPILRLHHLLYLRHSDEGQMQLATHSRLLLQELAPRLADTGDPSSRHRAARFYTALAADLERLGLPSVAAAAFADAAALDPTDRGALLALAAIRARIGDTRGAVELLERLVAAHPGDTEGRLRLGVGLARLGRSGPAETTLRPLLAAEQPWVASLAHQEVARLAIAAARWEEAEGVLRSGLARLGEDQKLLLQLGLVLDRQGRRADADEVLARLDGATGGESPRRRFSLFPWAAVETAAQEVDRAVAERLARIDPAIESLGRRRRR